MQKYYLLDQVLQQNDLELAIEVEDIGVGHLICEKVRFKALFFKHVHANIRVLDNVLIVKCYHLEGMT